ncbi:hypothetical protein HWV62_24426 [Athelia sp. TMB]|nr:hypothetical protein HWV62_24426 [Athelia sp. TMB]
MLPFLREQSQIQHLGTGMEYDLTEEPGNAIDNLLPQVSVASVWYETPVLFKLVASRPLQRLKLFMSLTQPGDYWHSDFLNALQILAPASATLTHFYYVHWGPFDADEAYHVDTLKNIARGLPNLKFLRYSDQIVLNVSISFLIEASLTRVFE